MKLPVDVIFRVLCTHQERVVCCLHMFYVAGSVCQRCAGRA